jgi:transketolase
MRNAFARTITRLAQQDTRIVLLSGDIGNRMFDPYKAACGGRFYNCGVAEANMITFAAGLAMSGMRPVAYTITPFITTRCLEQIRLDVCYHAQPVVIIGVGAGLSYASLGSTHHACEDIAFMRSLPGMTVVCPGDALEVEAAVEAAMQHDGPVYLRIGKKNEPLVHDAPPQMELGRSLNLRNGDQIALLCAGTLLPVACDAADELARHGLSVRLESFHTVKPLDINCLHDCFHGSSVVVTIEEHSMIGGFGSAVAEWLAEQPVSRATLLRIAAPDAFIHETGSQAYLRKELGLTSEAIVQRVLATLDVLPSARTA